MATRYVKPTQIAVGRLYYIPAKINTGYMEEDTWIIVELLAIHSKVFEVEQVGLPQRHTFMLSREHTSLYEKEPGYVNMVSY